MGSRSRGEEAGGPGEPISVVPYAAPPEREIGVTAVRRPDTERHRRAHEPRVTAAEAGAESPLFPGGGAAFARWAEKEKKIGPAVRQFVSDWGPLLLEFALRAISGHRRRSGGAR